MGLLFCRITLRRPNKGNKGAGSPISGGSGDLLDDPGLANHVELPEDLSGRNAARQQAGASKTRKRRRRKRRSSSSSKNTASSSTASNDYSKETVDDERASASTVLEKEATGKKKATEIKNDETRGIGSDKHAGPPEEHSPAGPDAKPPTQAPVESSESGSATASPFEFLKDDEKQAPSTHLLQQLPKESSGTGFAQKVEGPGDVQDRGRRTKASHIGGGEAAGPLFATKERAADPEQRGDPAQHNDGQGEKDEGDVDEGAPEKTAVGDEGMEGGAVRTKPSTESGHRGADHDVGAFVEKSRALSSLPDPECNKLTWSQFCYGPNTRCRATFWILAKGCRVVKNREAQNAPGGGRPAGVVPAPYQLSGSSHTLTGIQMAQDLAALNKLVFSRFVQPIYNAVQQNTPPPPLTRLKAMQCGLEVAGLEGIAEHFFVEAEWQDPPRGYPWRTGYGWAGGPLLSLEENRICPAPKPKTLAEARAQANNGPPPPRKPELFEMLVLQATNLTHELLWAIASKVHSWMGAYNYHFGWGSLSATNNCQTFTSNLLNLFVSPSVDDPKAKAVTVQKASRLFGVGTRNPREAQPGLQPLDPLYRN
ncbi:unnamed protein product [Amoebophrya sp. A120]|nr:unnamed protein product [Amoebophrya sp. A120]|eukprot:GSA120T00006794001.1